MRLETERLVIRSAVASDAPGLQRLFSDPDVRRWLPPGEPWTIERANEAIARRTALEREQGYTAWIELAYHYLPSAWGKGYGTEAATAVLAHGLGAVGLDEIIAICFPENI